MDEWDEMTAVESETRLAPRRCFHDGHEFDGEVYRFPVEHMNNTNFRMSALIFCSLSCAKAHIRHESIDPIYLIIFVHYCAEKYGVFRVNTALPLSLLAAFRFDGQGMTISEWRSHSGDPLVEKNHESIDLQVFEHTYQTTFNALIVDRRSLDPEQYTEAVLRANEKKRNKRIANGFYLLQRQ